MKEKNKRKSMKNSKCVLLICLLVLVSCVAGCKSKNVDKTQNNLIPEDYQAIAEDDAFAKDFGYLKTEITIDGVLDEDTWAKLQPLSITGKTTTTIKGFYGAEGIYFGAVVEDADLSGNSSKVTSNSSLELYLDSTGNGANDIDNTNISFYFDVNGNSITRMGMVSDDGGAGYWTEVSLDSYIVSSGTENLGKIRNAVTVQGTLDDSKKDQGYVMEIFIPYFLIGGMPDTDYGLGVQTINCQKSIRVGASGNPGLSSKNPSSYYKFYRDTNTIEPRRKVNLAKSLVDGKADDAIWTGRTSYTYGKDVVAVSNYYADEGAYFFFEVTDDKVCAGDGKNWNDTVIIFLDTKGNGGEKPQTDDAQIVADVKGNVKFYRGNGTEWKNTASDIFTGIQILNGSLNNAADGYHLEVFIPWKDLSLTTAPASMKVNFSCWDWDGAFNAEGEKVTKWYGTGHSTKIISEYILMTKNFIEGTVPQSEVKLDGVLDDALWEKSRLSYLFGMTTKIRWVWTDAGCYMGFDITDGNLVTTNNQPNQNSDIEIYLDYGGDGGKLGDGNRFIMIDAGGQMKVRKPDQESVFRTYSKTSIQSAVSQTLSGYVVEVYIPWHEFGGQRPTQMGVTFGNTLFWEDGTKRWYNDGYCIKTSEPDLYAIFTEDGIKGITY